MKSLSKKAPPVHKEFNKGNFSIREKPSRFTVIGGGQKLKQGINLSSKNNDSVKGHAKQKQFIAQWDLIYHEMMG